MASLCRRYSAPGARFWSAFNQGDAEARPSFGQEQKEALDRCVLYGICHVSVGKRVKDHVALSKPPVEMGTHWRICLSPLASDRRLPNTTPGSRIGHLTLSAGESVILIARGSACPGTPSICMSEGKGSEKAGARCDALSLWDAKIIAHGLCWTCYSPKRQDAAYFGGLRERILERDTKYNALQRTAYCAFDHGHRDACGAEVPGA